MDEDVMKEFNEEISNLKTPDELEIIKNRYLGKKGIIKNLMENIKNISDIQQKKEYGEKINKIKKEIEKQINILEKN